MLFRAPVLAALAAALLLTATPALAQRSDAREVVFRQTFAVRDGQALTVDVGAGSVVVETTASGQAEVTVEGRGENVRAAFERQRFTATAAGGRLTLRTRARASMGRTEADFVYTVRVPRRFDADVDTGSGNVSVGPLDGALSVDTGSGNVTTGAVTGRLSIDTGSGNVRMADAGAAASISTGSGNVEASLSRVVRLSVDTGSGSVRLTLPRGADATLALDGGAVRIDDALGFVGRRESREAQGRVGRGGERISVETGSGGISVSAR